MKTVNLTKAEIDVILTLSEKDICVTTCYCGYKTNMCDRLAKDGSPKCGLKKTIESIRDKLGATD